ncbi:MAG: tetratricopeptide repeat protein [Gammaproteobacteria bacterium]
MWKFATTTNNPRSPRPAARALVALAVAAFAVIPASAQIFSDDVAREQAARNAEKLADLARIVENLRGQLGAMAQERQASDRRLRELSGQIEELAAAGAGKTELKTLETSAARAALERTKIAEDLAALRAEFSEISAFVGLPPEQEFYDAAFADYQGEKYARAADGFQKLLKYYPDGKFNANARYWTSRSFLASGEYESAAATARRLIELHEDGDKIPDAMLVLAEALQNLGQEEESRATLRALIAAHPTTLAADRARQSLPPSP